MKCPRTGKALAPVNVGGIEVDVSEGCGGVWFDQFELEKFTAPSDTIGKVLVDHLKQYHKPLTDQDQRIRCPLDTDVVMMRRFYSGKLQIEIDECPQCGGIWLDAEELEKIHHLFPDKIEFESAQNKFLDEVLSSPEFKQNKIDQDSFIRKLENVTNALRSMLGMSKI